VYKRQRGLGDVYKRQVLQSVLPNNFSTVLVVARTAMPSDF
jgi:hypothetical protein